VQLALEQNSRFTNGHVALLVKGHSESVTGSLHAEGDVPAGPWEMHLDAWVGATRAP